MRNIIVLLLFCCGMPAVQAQQLYFNHLSVNNGLSQGVNNCIVKDSKGFVWISSFDGLNRFDGIDCRKYYAVTGAEKGIKGTLFLNILEDKAGNMWIGSNEGLNCYYRKNDSFVCYKIENRIAEQFCSPFYIDDAGRIWVQSGAGIFIFDPQQKQFVKRNSIKAGSNFVFRVYPQQLYHPVETLLATSAAAPVMYKGRVSANTIHWQPVTLSLNNAAINTMQLYHHYCWLGTTGGLYRCDINNPGDCIKLPAVHQNISSLQVDNTGVLWAGTRSHGLLKLDSTGNIIQHFTSNADNTYSLSGNQVTYIYTDDSRNLWVALWGKGVDYTNLDKFHFNQYVNKTEAIKAGADNFLRSVITVNGETWCATQSGGILVLDGEKKIQQVIKKDLPSSIESLCADGNTVWAATFSGLYSIDAITKKVSGVSVSSAANMSPGSFQYNYVHKLHDGSLLLSANAGLYKVTKVNGRPQVILLKGIPATDVYLTTWQNSNGDLFISKPFKGFGIYRLLGDSLTGIKQFPVQATIKCFSSTNDSVLWIGSTTGLIQFNTNTSVITKVYTTNDGLKNQYIYGVVPYGKYLWLSSNAGISRFNPADGAVKIFSISDGLQSNEFNTYSFCKTSENEILFGGVNGLNGFNPATLQPFKKPPALVLSAVAVEDSLYHSLVSYDELDKVDVSYKENTVAFSFSVIDYVNPGAAYIRYILEGFDKSWVTAANKSFIRYANLPPGNYMLKVKAFSADGTMAEKIFQLPVSVRPAWWQTWWFSLMVVLAAAAAGIVFLRNYLNRKLQKQRIAIEKELAVEQERVRMARELHDGLGSMLSGIKHSFSAIKNEVALNSEQQHKFEYTIDKLDDSIKDLRAVSHGMFSAELLEEGLEAAVKNYCNSIIVTAKINIVFESIMRQPPGLTGEQAFHVFRVVQELVQNIIKHSGASEAMVQLSLSNHTLSITVEDNGTGFNVQQVHEKGGIGLRNVDARIKLLHGKTDIKSLPGKGTSVYIELPVG